ncbi:PBP1A family penicillin-binding protein [Terrilactibacillus sp. BCM23-1]|uniref:PBP1A family penicillin-binding protein n=1 Tax=Terrilactibacillus tamarindi TaxID=2599694 RepID=A0A6N8CP86_9BACI|nr:PBP1A family penicillin-binding protein [Terrilactibacillus tamarindi]MTT30957.1 PBP1A family penicillin-binding protein [Terrilactibacillus tamarindi]
MKFLTNRKRYRGGLRWVFRLNLFFLLLFLIGIAGLWIVAKIAGPPPLNVPKAISYYDSHGNIFNKATDSALSSSSEWTKLDHISKPLIQATLSIEDKHFYKHHGFDLRRLAGALFADVKSFSKAQGASTITMQYAKNSFLSNDKTWTRKLAEAFYTMRLEMNYSKDQILEGYLNTIYYGHGAYGIQAASKYYFNKNASDLSLSEASMLAGIPKGPSLYAPDVHYERAKERQKIVLQSMVKNGTISKQLAHSASNHSLKLVKERPKKERLAPYFQQAVRDELKNKLHLTDDQLINGGLNVYTTLDPKIQKKAEYWIKDTIDPKSDIQSALVSMNPKTGAVLALIGGRDYDKSAFNRATQSRRSPGSSFKPFLYYAALQDGFTPSTLLKSAPTSFQYDDDRATYSPSNFGNYYANKKITMAEALAVSDNIYAVKTHMSIGMDELVKTAKEVGIRSPLAPIPSLALGSKPVSMLEITRGYSAIANGGYRVQPHFVKKVTDKDGNVLYEWKPKNKKVLNKKAAFVLSQMMTGIFDKHLNGYTTVTGSKVANILTHKVAAKTGSTATDSWMVGFTPKLAMAVWVGYDQGETISVYPDSGYAKKIWAHSMESALSGKSKNSFKPPKGVVAVNIDPKTGLRATDTCPGRETYFIKGTAPKAYCDGTKVVSHPKHKKKTQSHGLFDWIFHLGEKK